MDGLRFIINILFNGPRKISMSRRFNVFPKRSTCTHALLHSDIHLFSMWVCQMRYSLHFFKDSESHHNFTTNDYHIVEAERKYAFFSETFKNGWCVFRWRLVTGLVEKIYMPYADIILIYHWIIKKRKGIKWSKAANLC